jgi:signal transduction histidine kinase
MYNATWNQFNNYTASVNRTQSVISAYEEFSSDMKSAQMMSSELGRKHSNALYELYKNDIESIPEDIETLKGLTKENPSQQKRIDSISLIYDAYISWMNKNKSSGGIVDSSFNLFLNTLSIQRLIDRGVMEEKVLLSNRKARFMQSATKTNVITVIFIFTSIILIIVIAVSNIYEVQKRAGVESFLESVLNTSQNGIITFQAIREIMEIDDFEVIFANGSVASQLGIQNPDMRGMRLKDVFHFFGFNNEIFDKFIQVTETGKRDEFEACYETGKSKRWFKIVLARLNDGFTSTFHDITELKVYQEELQVKVEELEHSNSELEQFAYVASHDLQEPLRKIKTFASLINERFNDPSASYVKLYLNKMIDSADRMSGLINDLLNFSYLSKGGQTYKRTDLNIILQNVLKDLELIIEEKKAVINAEPLMIIEAIALQMNQLFYNLINNALKFSKPGVTPVIDISIHKLQPADAVRLNLDKNLVYHVITVRDNGIGFNQEYAEKIFVIFQRLNSRQSYSGSGIGLALCRKITLNHSGTIYAESTENNGAAFHIVLPVHQPVDVRRESLKIHLPVGQKQNNLAES